jgi:hypothetical protein
VGLSQKREIQLKRQVFLALAIATFITLGLFVAHQRAAGTPPQQHIAIPTAFKSAVEGVNIVYAKVVYDETDGKPALEVTIQNNTPRSVIAILLTSSESNHSSGYGSGGTRENPILSPFGSFTMRYQASGLIADKPLAVSAVVWDDGTASGYPLHAERFRQNVAKGMVKAGDQ